MQQVFREDYLQGLKALTNNGNAEPYVRAMGMAQRFTSLVKYEPYEACVLDLTQRNAFSDPDKSKLVWQN